MPYKAKHQCNYPGCPRLTDKRYCPPHEKLVQKQYEMTRETAVARGYDTRWQRVRHMQLARNPLCEWCEAAGRTSKAVLVHHIDRNPKNNLANNLVSLCAGCHDKEHAGERWRQKDNARDKQSARAER